MTDYVLRKLTLLNKILALFRYYFYYRYEYLSIVTTENRPSISYYLRIPLISNHYTAN